MTSAPRVVVVGDVMTDIIVRPEGPLIRGSDRRAHIERLPGGSGANQAAWLASAGLAVSFVGRVGASELDRHAGELRAHGVEPVLAADPARPSGTLVALIDSDGERSFLTDRGANAGLGSDDLSVTLLDGAALLHVSGYALVDPGPRMAVLAYAAEATRRGVPVSWDPGSAGFLRDLGPEQVLAWTHGAWLCVPNEEEATLLAGSSDPEEQRSRLLNAYHGVAIKRGALGADAAFRGQSAWQERAPPRTALDTTGAGDAFLAGFVASLLRGASLQSSLAEAVGWGSWAVTRLGGRPPRPAHGPA